jgi:2,4-dienoyl-CoA reductase-like NADH-dependent reductase (Old Yellow Enzyme family)/flavin-dependent dehydrogenase
MYPTIAEAEKFYLRMANNGAGVVTFQPGTYPGRELDSGRRYGGLKLMSMLDPDVRKGFKGINDKLHAMGTLSSASLMDIEPQDVGIADIPNWDEIPRTGDYSERLHNCPGISAERLEKMLQEFIFRSKDLYSVGFDMVTFYMSYRGSILANSLSPCYNQRTDKYGGKTMAERARLTLELFSRIKKACPGLLIEVQISGEEEPPGYTVKDWLEYCKLCEGLVDIFQVRGYDGSSTHVCGHNMKPHSPPNLRYAEAFKKAGIKALVSPVGGFGDPDDIEKFLAEGKTDLVSISRYFLVDSEYGKKVAEGRGEDITPCLLCNGCHGRHRCAVNPKASSTISYPKPAKSKKVAVLGGGPGGMEAALTAAERGHKVTLFEKKGVLGGQLVSADYPGFKWPIKAYRDWMSNKIAHSNIDLRLNTEATPELLKAGGYDAIICALGSVAKNVPVPGADADFVWLADEVYGHEAELGHRVVIVGGASTARETAVYLAECGHKVTMITRTQAVFFSDLHSQRAEEDACLKNPNFSYIEHATTKEIGKGYVVCDVKLGIPHVPMGFTGFVLKGDSRIRTLDGALEGPGWPVAVFDESHVTVETRRVEFDSVVVSGGRKPNAELAESFRSVAPEFYIIGDNAKVEDIRESIYSGYDAAMRL